MYRKKLFGVNFEIEYVADLSNHDYTKHIVYKIKADKAISDDNNLVEETINSIMEEFLQKEVWSKKTYDEIYKRDGGFINAMHPYYTLAYDIEHMYTYTLVIPYDD